VKRFNIKIMNVKENLPNLPGLATVLAPISWGTTYVTVTELLPDGRPLLIASTRVLPAGLMLVAIGLLSSRWRPRGAEWGRTALLALCNFGLFFPLLAVAVYRLPGGVAAAAGGLQPLFVIGLSRALVRRRPPRREIVIGIVAALGVGLVVVRPGADIDMLGVLAAVAANLSFAAGVVLTKRFPAPLHRLAATGWQLLLSAVLLVPLTVAVEGAPPTLTGRNLAGFGYLSLIGTAAAFVVWFAGISKLPTAAPPLLGLAAPVTGALLGWVVLDQSLSPAQLTGFAMTLGAIAYGAVLGGRPVGPPAAPVHAAATSAGRQSTETLLQAPSRAVSARAGFRTDSREAQRRAAVGVIGGHISPAPWVIPMCNDIVQSRKEDHEGDPHLCAGGYRRSRLRGCPRPQTSDR
jgi:probable blue pigment (indigoidine) exporter